MTIFSNIHSLLLLSSLFVFHAEAKFFAVTDVRSPEQNGISAQLLAYNSAYKTVNDLITITSKMQNETSANTHLKALIACMDNEYAALDDNSKAQQSKLVIDYMSASVEARSAMTKAMMKLFIEIQRMKTNDYFNNAKLKSYFHLSQDGLKIK